MNDWRYGRDGYLTEWDDYEFSDSWSGQRTIWETPLNQKLPRSNMRESIYGSPHRSRLLLKIFVTGRRSGSRRLRPTHVRPSLHFGSCRVDLSRVRCTSVLDATRQADAHPELEAKAQELLHKVYSKRGASSLYRKPDGNRDYPGPSAWDRINGQERWLPWASMFEAFHSPITWPMGTYAEVRYDRFRDAQITVLHEITHWGSSGATGIETPELPAWAGVE